MTYTHPQTLYLLLILPLGFYLFRHARKVCRHGLAHFGLSSQSILSPPWLLVQETASMATLVFLILALAGPRYGYEWDNTPLRGRHLVLVLDCSKSMYAQDVPPSRMVAAKHEIEDILKNFSGEKVGLVAFSGTAFLQCPLTTDREGLGLFLDSLEPYKMPLGGTNLGEALQVALEALPRETADHQAILLITDAESTQGSIEPFIAEAKRRNVPIFALAIGTFQGAPIPDPVQNGAFIKDSHGKTVMAKVNDKLLEHIARETGGKALRANPGDMDTQEMVREIQKILKTTNLEGGPRKVSKNRFQWFALGALLCLVIFTICQGKRKKSGDKVFAYQIFAALLLGAVSLYVVGVENPSQAEAQGPNGNTQPPRQDALSSLLQKQVASPEDPHIAYNVGNTYYRMGLYDEARKNYESLFDQKTSWKELTSELKEAAWYNRGNALYRMGKLEESIESYKKALELNPQDREAQENMAFVQRQLEERKKGQHEPPKEKDCQNGDGEKDDSEENRQTREKSSQEEKSDQGDHHKEGSQGGKASQGKDAQKDSFPTGENTKDTPKSDEGLSPDSPEKHKGDRKNEDPRSQGQHSENSRKDGEAPSQASPKEQSQKKDESRKPLKKEVPGHQNLEGSQKINKEKELQSTEGKDSSVYHDLPEKKEEVLKPFYQEAKGLSQDKTPLSEDTPLGPSPTSRDVSLQDVAPELKDLRQAQEDQFHTLPHPPLSPDTGMVPDMEDRLLHRLQDMPGEALIPRGHFKRAEKDW